MPAGISGVHVDATALRLSTDHDAAADLVLDVLLDGRRVWSFRPGRAGHRDRGSGQWVVPWPTTLTGFLDGEVRLALASSDGTTVYDEEIRLGTAGRRIVVADRSGRPLIVDNSGRLAITFGSQGASDVAPLLDALERVIAELAAAGVAAFPAYGTLLGAVRGGKLIGHDTDADVGYLSRFDHPVDVIRESFRLQRVLLRSGLDITRHSGGAFKVEVRAGDGSVRGLDVFSGALIDGHLMLMGELFVPFERSWLLPLGTVELEGRTLPAPAEPERLLVAMYGPDWREPDPAFEFATPDDTIRRLDSWFRGTRAFRNHWDRRYSDAREHGPIRQPHDLARLVHRAEPPGSTVVDLGCGRGQDAVWLAARGHPAIGLDFATAGFTHLKRRAAEEGWPVDFQSMNLLELRHTLVWGARLARLEGPRTLMARHLVDATSPRGRHHLWRLSAMALAGGGRLYVEFVTDGRDDGSLDESLLRPLDPGEVVEEVAEFGGRVVSAEEIEARWTGQPASSGAGGQPRPGCRMVMEWSR